MLRLGPGLYNNRRLSLNGREGVESSNSPSSGPLYQSRPPRLRAGQGGRCRRETTGGPSARPFGCLRWHVFFGHLAPPDMDLPLTRILALGNKRREYPSPGIPTASASGPQCSLLGTDRGRREGSERARRAVRRAPAVGMMPVECRDWTGRPGQLGEGLRSGPSLHSSNGSGSCAWSESFETNTHVDDLVVARAAYFSESLLCRSSLLMLAPGPFQAVDRPGKQRRLDTRDDSSSKSTTDSAWRRRVFEPN